MKNIRFSPPSTRRFSVRIRRARALFYCCLLLTAWAQILGRAQPRGAALTQRRINEIAASCITAHMALQGAKEGRRPTETSAQFRMRVEGYLAALARVSREVEPVRLLPVLRDRRPENVRRWRKIMAAASQLPAEVWAVRAAWDAYAKQPDGSRLDHKLLAALTTVMEILNGLRDARP
jgi:hypothetical protein